MIFRYRFYAVSERRTVDKDQFFDKPITLEYLYAQFVQHDSVMPMRLPQWENVENLEDKLKEKTENTQSGN